MNINQVILVGRLAEPVNYVPENGKISARATGRLIVNRPPSNNSKEPTYDAIQFVAWGRNADNMARFTDKGKELGLIGELRVNNVPPKKAGDSWRNYTEVMVHRIQFGRDSSQAKAMKALESGTPMAAVLPDGAEMRRQLAALKKNDKLMAKLREIGQLAAPQKAVDEDPFA